MDVLFSPSTDVLRSVACNLFGFEDPVRVFQQRCKAAYNKCWSTVSSLHFVTFVSKISHGIFQWNFHKILIR